uniref:Adenine DNA glycosylase n=1 Tax=Desulfobacca acetoxidans TaxID=60893 RepID=A0A7V6A352_9BACT
MPWRQTRNPYHILVSEIMLQQSQVERVMGKYGDFLAKFPDFRTLAGAPWPEVMAVWQGLGYNRRALSLKRLAQAVMENWGGVLPAKEEDLRSLPGIGPATAGALLAFAFEQPVTFIETNIRRVFLHFFFSRRTGITDGEILPLVAETLDHERVRDWYYALMDYGVELKKTGPNPNRRSAHYSRQSPFNGSNREVRGRILQTLLSRPALSVEELARTMGISHTRTRAALEQLLAEGFVIRHDEKVCLARHV